MLCKLKPAPRPLAVQTAILVAAPCGQGAPPSTWAFFPAPLSRCLSHDGSSAAALCTSHPPAHLLLSLSPSRSAAWCKYSRGTSWHPQKDCPARLLPEGSHQNPIPVTRGPEGNRSDPLHPWTVQLESRGHRWSCHSGWATGPGGFRRISQRPEKGHAPRTQEAS